MCCRLICVRAQTNSEWFMRTPRDACMGSNMVRAEFGSGLIRLRAQTCCASPTRTPPRLANSPGFKSFHCPRWRIKFSLERFSDSISNRCACPAVEKFCRASSAGPPDFRTLYGLKWATSVEIRHGLPISEARRCSACANPLACPAVGKFSRASSAGGRRLLQ
jgi:hypothetical protein